MKNLTVAVFFIIFVISCHKKDGSARRVSVLYKNDSFEKVQGEPHNVGITPHIVKVSNTHSKPIVVPISEFHQWSVDAVFVSEVRGDSIVDISLIAVPFLLNLGVDTIYPGETQRYFVELALRQDNPRKGTYEFITLSYYFLDDFHAHPFDHKFRRREVFLLYRDSLGELHHYDTPPGFDPDVQKSYPLPPTF